MLFPTLMLLISRGEPVCAHDQKSRNVSSDIGDKRSFVAPDALFQMIFPYFSGESSGASCDGISCACVSDPGVQEAYKKSSTFRELVNRYVESREGKGAQHPGDDIVLELEKILTEAGNPANCADPYDAVMAYAEIILNEMGAADPVSVPFPESYYCESVVGAAGMIAAPLPWSFASPRGELECEPLESEQTETASPELANIKTEDCSHVRLWEEHAIDNALPVLQHPHNPSCSLLSEAEVPVSEIRVTNWGGINEIVHYLPVKERDAIKAEITAQIRDLLQNPDRLTLKLDALMTAAIPIDDGPARGRSVFAKRDIAQFEVLGPYSGRLHQTSESLADEIKRKGIVVQAYLFATRSGQRVVSAFGTGNILSLINTARLPGRSSEWGHNNVLSISVGRNLTFFVASEMIKRDTELLIDYGEHYDPMPHRPIQEVKKEPVS